MRSNPNSNAKPVTGTNAAASGSDSVLTVAADPLEHRILQWVSWSYDAAPASGGMVIATNAATINQFDITSAGPGIKHFSSAGSKGLYIDKNLSLTATLADGTCNSKLNWQYI